MSEEESKVNYKSLLLTVLMTLLITGGLVTAFAKQLINFFNIKTTYYTCTLTIQNGKNIPLNNLYIKMNNDSLLTSDSGTVMFHLIEDRYLCTFKYKNQKHREYYHVSKDTNIILDISKSLTNPITGEKIISNLLQPNTSADQKVVKIPDAIRITSSQPAQASSELSNYSKSKTTLSANEILQALQLSVEIDHEDSKENEKFVAYHYRLTGKESYLNQIKEVLYQRNHSTFPEFKSDEFYSSENRESSFEFTGHQWGYVTTTFVQIVLKNDDSSDIMLKTIKYTN